MLKRDDLAVWQDVVHRPDWLAPSLVDGGHFLTFTDVFSSKQLARFPRHWDATKDGLSQPWAGGNLWLHPPDRLWEQTVQKLENEQGQGIAIVPTCKDRDWWWSLTEVVVDRVDALAGEPMFVNNRGTVCSIDREYRMVLIDAFGWTPEGAASAPVDTAEQQQALWSTKPSRGDSVLVDPHDCTVGDPHPIPPLNHRYTRFCAALISQTAIRTAQKVSFADTCSVSFVGSLQRGPEKGDTTQSETEASSRPDFSSSEESGAEQKQQSLTHVPVINPLGRNRHMLGPTEINQHEWVQGYGKHMWSVIQSDEDWDGCDDLKDKSWSDMKSLSSVP